MYAAQLLLEPLSVKFQVWMLRQQRKMEKVAAPIPLLTPIYCLCYSSISAVTSQQTEWTGPSGHCPLQSPRFTLPCLFSFHNREYRSWSTPCLFVLMTSPSWTPPTPLPLSQNSFQKVQGTLRLGRDLHTHFTEGFAHVIGQKIKSDLEKVSPHCFAPSDW